MRNLYLFSQVDDVWESGLRDWFRVASKNSLEANEKWFVVASLVQANWLRQRCLREHLTLFGVKFFDLRLLRRELCRRAGLPSPSFGRETLRLLVQATLSDDLVGQSFSEHLVAALDELAAAGWVDTVGLDQALAEFALPELTRNVLKDLLQSVFWRPRVDQLLKRNARSQRLAVDLGVFGLSVFAIPDLTLVEAAARSVSRLDCWLPQPIGNESIGFQLITNLEEALQTQHVVCPASGSLIPYAPFIANWSGQTDTAAAPEIIVADEWNDQVRAIVSQVVDALNGGVRSIAIIVPENSATGSATMNALAELQIPFADEFRQQPLGSPETRIQVALLNLLEGEQAVDSFLDFVEALVGDLANFREIRKKIHQAFDRHQERSIRKLRLHGSLPDWLLKVIDLLEPWPEKLEWGELSDRWLKLLDDLSDLARRGAGRFEMAGTETIEPLWYEIGKFMEGRKVSSKLFFGFVRELISNTARQIHPGSGHRYCNLILTTARKAFGCSWDLVILSDSATGGWPILGPRNPLLVDRRRLQLGDQGFLLPTALDRRQSELDLYLQIIYQTRNRVVLIYHDRDAKGDELVPNDLVTFTRQFLQPKFARYLPIDRTEPEGGSFASIWTRRRDPALPFDEWFLNFSSGGFPPQTWSPSNLENAFNTPGTFAFEQMFRSQREWDAKLFRDPRRAIGRLVHTVLAGALGPGEEISASVFAGIGSAAEIERSFMEQINRACESEMTALPADLRNLWWESVFDQVRLTALRIGAHLAKHLNGRQWFATERRIEGLCLGGDYQLQLYGRSDLILLDRPRLKDAVTGVFDFKTGKNLQRIKLAEGAGLQFYAYQRLFEEAGAQSVTVYQSRIEGTFLIDFGDPGEARPVLEYLSKMQKNSCFGEAPAPFDQFEMAEALPIAALSYPPELLMAKRNLTF